MKKLKKATKSRNILFSFGFLFLILTTSATASLNISAQVPDVLVSPALSVLAEQNSMAMAGLKGNSIAFEASDFARALNLSQVSEITVTQTPAITDGELRVGSTVVASGTTITGNDLSLLTYSAKADITTSSFRFRAGNAPYEMTCKLYLLDRVNHAPTLSMVPKTSLNVSTHRNITLYGTLPCYDPDGDVTKIEIVSYPSSGILILTDSTTGEYTFTPGANYSGKDSFTYVARDLYGNYSASATVSLTVEKPTTSVVYTDLASSPCYNAALTMTEAGIMSGTQIGTNTYFYPDQTVSRAEFTVMAMNAVGIREVNENVKTVFADDDEIPGYMKGYIAAAYDLGYIKGTYVDGKLCFEGDRAITRAEAAVLLGNMLNASTPTITPGFHDSADIPTWAVPSVNSLSSMGILASDNGKISPLAAVTRGDAAEILTNLMRTVG